MEFLRHLLGQVTPFTVIGSGSPAASRIVGATSMTWWNCHRISPFALIPFGQWTIVPLRVPPTPSTARISVQRSEIWLINLDPAVGAEIKKTRPAVIVNE
jgi:hypothetical protein